MLAKFRNLEIAPGFRFFVQISRLSSHASSPRKRDPEKREREKTGGKPEESVINPNVPDLGSRFRGKDEKEIVLGLECEKFIKIHSEILSKNPVREGGETVTSQEDQAASGEETLRIKKKKARFAPHAGPLSPDPNLPPGLRRWGALAIATGLGTGFSPFAPGTVGTLVGVALFWFLAPPFGGWGIYTAATVGLIALGIHAATLAEGIYRKKDDGRIVIDEVVGYLVTMLGTCGVDDSTVRKAWIAAAGFLVFRFFDILKPPPAYQFQALPGGYGIVIDDVMAGVYGCLTLHLGLFLWGMTGFGA